LKLLLIVSSAYIAASRRSDRSLEARIESARRASEIHKKRTGRALRVTEQDVINEEMYEEEDDDLPTQYQRLNAHLHTTSVMFNKKLHDYIATQHGVRNMFMSQYQNPSFPQYGGQQYPQQAAAFPQANNWLNPSMLPPQQFNPASPQLPVTQQTQPFNPNGTQQQNFRKSPYPAPQRLNSHQRALSIQLPQAMGSVETAPLSAPGGATTPQESFRRMSLPAHAFEQESRASSDGKARSTSSQTPTTQSPVQSTSSRMASSPATSGQTTPQLHVESETPASYPYSAAGYPFTSQVLNTNPLSMSMPPESQQFIGSALDMSDPRHAMFMAGSDNLPQPFAPTYTYNPNFSGKSGRSSSVEETLAPGNIKSETVDGPTTMPSEGFFNNDSLFTPGNGDYNSFFDFPSTDFTQSLDEQGDGSNFVNWD
jgi:hypothetical protein